jgi:hypothetical protein
MAGGRPLKFTPEELQGLFDKYFQECKDNGEPLTITGLALAAGTSRETLSNYEKREEFFDIIKNAHTKVEHGYEKRLADTACTGAIFALKNMGWKDKHEVESTNTTRHIVQSEPLSEEAWQEKHADNQDMIESYSEKMLN